MIGLLPAAGNATRINGLPKYLLPVPGGHLLNRHICGMRAVGCTAILVGSNSENERLLKRYAEDAHVYYAFEHRTMTATVLSSRVHYGRNENILFSMPDTYWNSPAVYLPLQMALESGADVAVALFQARPGQQAEGGAVQVAGGQVLDVIDKTDECGYPYIWGALAWTPKFWAHLDADDPHVGYGLPRAITAGLDVRAVVCAGQFWDCGTPERYFACIRALDKVAV